MAGLLCRADLPDFVVQNANRGGRGVWPGMKLGLYGHSADPDGF
jgi:hypothetical protein